MCVLEKLLGLLKNFGMSDVIHVKHAIRINNDWIIWIVSIWDTWIYKCIVILSQPVWKVLDFLINLQNLVVLREFRRSSWLRPLAEV